MQFRQHTTILGNIIIHVFQCIIHCSKHNRYNARKEKKRNSKNSKLHFIKIVYEIKKKQQQQESIIQRIKQIALTRFVSNNIKEQRQQTYSTVSLDILTGYRQKCEL